MNRKGMRYVYVAAPKNAGRKTRMQQRERKNYSKHNA
jgi:hypothetical protein